MKRIFSRRILAASAFLAALGVAGTVIGLPEYLARTAIQIADSCLDARIETRCRFVGGPLEIAGQPVFLEKYQHAFLPTKGKIDFIDASGQTWTVPPRTLTDGASIPAIFSAMIGDRQSREYLIAAALHDAYCGVGNEELETYRTRPWTEVHRMFYEALIVNGTPPQKAKIMFAAVYLGGPRWDDPARALDGVPAQRLLDEMKWCLEWIRTNDPTADEIEAWMEARETALKAGDPVDAEYRFSPQTRGI